MEGTLRTNEIRVITLEDAHREANTQYALGHLENGQAWVELARFLLALQQESQEIRALHDLEKAARQFFTQPEEEGFRACSTALDQLDRLRGL